MTEALAAHRRVGGFSHLLLFAAGLVLLGNDKMPSHLLFQSLGPSSISATRR
jgi:hypothetical protein